MSSDAGVSTSRRADACAVAVAMILPTLASAVCFVWLAGAPTAVLQPAYAAGKGFFLFPLLWVLGVQRRKLHWQPPRGPGLIEGTLFGLAVAGAMLLVYHGWLGPAGLLLPAAEPVRDKLAGFGLDSAAKYVAFGVVLSLIHSFLEEYYWRWFVFGQLRRLISLPAAVALSSLAFMSHHVVILGEYFGWLSWPTLLFSLAVALGGAVWAWIYHRSGSLYGPWISHVFVDVAIFVIGWDLVGF